MQEERKEGRKAEHGGAAFFRSFFFPISLSFFRPFLLSSFLPFLLLSFALPSIAAAQARWLKPYESGVKAVAEGRWQDAVRDLETAIKYADRQEENKLVEGVVRTPYYPYVYLFIAQLKLNQLDRARETLAKATERPLPSRFETFLRPHREEFDRLNKPAPPPPPKPTPTPPPPATINPPPPTTVTPPPVTPPPPTDPARGTTAKPTPPPAPPPDPGRSTVKPVTPEVDPASARERARTLANEGQALVKNNRLTEARSRFEQAEALSPGTGQAGLAAIRARQQEYARHKAATNEDVAASRWSEALANLQKAFEADPEAYRLENMGLRKTEIERRLAADTAAAAALARAKQQVAAAQGLIEEGKYGQAAERFREALKNDPANAEAKAWLDQNTQYEQLKASGTSLFSQGKLEEALQPLSGAQRLDPKRFEAEGLGATIARIHATRARAPEAQLAPVRQAVTSYLKGDVDAAIAVLQPLAEKSGTLDPAVRAHVHAYLGVVYATRAFLSVNDADQKSLQQQALDQFRLVIAAKPDYQLSPMVSPRIQKLLNQSRGAR